MVKRRVAPALLRVGRRIVASIFPPSTGREVTDELDFHVEMRVREHVEAGMDEAEARRLAVAAFGDMDEVRARCARLAEEREGKMRRSAWLEDLGRDVGFGLRQLARSPGFTAVTVLTLGLAIGANTAVYSVVHGVLLEPLPFEEPDELVSVWTRYLPSTGLDIPQFPASAPEILDYREASDAMEDVAAYSLGRANLGGDEGDPLSLRVVQAGRGLASVLGVRPALGRTFTAAEQAPGAAPALLLSHRLWVDRFGADPGAVGRTVTLDGAAALVVGVLPAGIDFPTEDVDAWRPLGLDEADPPSRGAHYLLAVARLAEGADLARAESELEAITEGWNERWEHHASGHFLFLRPLRDDLVGEARPVLLALMAAVALVLLIAFGNIANLFLVRGEARDRELAVRTALGAGRGRLLRQLLTEGALVSLAGGVFGVALAAWGTPLLLSIDPGAIPRSGDVSLGVPVLGFTALLVVAASFLFGALPGLRAARPNGPGAGLAGGRDGVAAPGRTWRRTLVAMEVAVSVVVLFGAALVVRSFERLRDVDAGVAEDGLATLHLALPANRYEDAGASVRFYEALAERVEALPGVVAAGATSALPGTGAESRWDFLPEGESPPGDGVPAWNASVRVVQPGFFDAAGIPVVRGRGLAPEDDASAPLAAVVDEATVRRFWGGQEVLGRRLTFSVGGDGGGPWFTVVGVVGDVLDVLTEPARPHIYLPHAQLGAADLGAARSMTLVARTSGDAGALLPALRGAVRELDPGLPTTRAATMEATLDAAVARERLSANVFAVFGLAALLLTTVGVYGVVSYTVTRRTREVGVRMALGAGRARVVRSLVSDATAPALVGAAAGLAAAALGAPLLQELLFEVPVRDPLALAGAAGGLLAVAGLASALPALRAARIEPSRALRD